MHSQRHLYDLNNVAMYYHKNGKKIYVIQKAHLFIPANLLVGILGATGSGKTTLLNILGGIVQPTAGEVSLYDNNNRPTIISKLKIKRREKFLKGRISWIFQNLKLIPHLGGWGNMIFPARLTGIDKEVAKNRAVDIAEKLEIKHLIKKNPTELSGGEKQLLAIGRALMAFPEIILADEPTSSLDQETAGKIMKILFNLVRASNISVIMVTHDHKIAYEYCDILFECKKEAQGQGCYVQTIRH